MRNAGARAGAYVGQIYVAGPTSARWFAPRRLGAFKKVQLRPEENLQVKLQIDPRLLAMPAKNGEGWTISAGEYRVILAKDGATPIEQVSVRLPAQRMPEG